MQSQIGQSITDSFRWTINYLGGCSIGDEGCEYLSRGQWHNILIIDLCKLVEMKLEIK
jgi:hypothetical protein